MTVRSAVFVCLILSSSLGWAQMTPAQARGYMSGMAMLRHEDRSAVYWSLTASDADLLRAIKNPTTKEAASAVMEARRRGRQPLIDAVAEAAPRSNEAFGLNALWLFTKVGGDFNRRNTERAVNHPVPEVRWRAASTAASWGYKPARRVLLEAIAKDRALPGGLAKVGEKEDIAAIRAYSKRNSGHAGETAVEVLALLGDKTAAAELRKRVDRTNDPYSRTRAIQTLGDLRDPADERRFVLQLRSGNMNVRGAAIEALGKLGRRSAAPKLRELALVTGKDAQNSPFGDLSRRMYARYVADSLEAGKRADSFKAWLPKNRQSIAAALDSRAAARPNSR